MLSYAAAAAATGDDGDDDEFISKNGYALK